MKRLIIAAAALICGIASAAAADLGSTSAMAPLDAVASSNVFGVYGYVTGGAEFASTAIGVTDGEDSAKLSGLGSNGWLGEVGVGADILPRGSKLGAGLFVAANVANTSSKLTIGDESTRLTRDWGWLAGARLFYAVNADSKIYVAGGYTQSDFTLKAGGEKRGDTLDGYFGELGYETRLTGNVYGKLSGRYTVYNDAKYGGGAVTLEPESLSVLAGVTVRLGN